MHWSVSRGQTHDKVLSTAKAMPLKAVWQRETIYTSLSLTAEPEQPVVQGPYGRLILRRTVVKDLCLYILKQIQIAGIYLSIYGDQTTKDGTG